jgi:hypothetical protein
MFAAIDFLNSDERDFYLKTLSIHEATELFNQRRFGIYLPISVEIFAKTVASTCKAIMAIAFPWRSLA